MSDQRAERRRQQRAAVKAHPADHCYHQFAPVYALQIGEGDPVPAVPEFCCHCAPVRLTIFREPPTNVAEHGPAFRFAGPPRVAPVQPPRPQLLVPSRPGLVH